ncbi:MAG: hypothetical protein E7813_06725 [Bradyrhizobium sp.]|uniref:primase 1D-like protein n=1 Tax=Bradyrhizobium sp. TaxID=376 RepID=UPI00121C480A|nr:hypothetical protein [Bradyrhizobium sp.]THD70963.1 MAG: hypothetical protein E7813_06725 [Bradyrhizobium sp.]
MSQAMDSIDVVVDLLKNNPEIAALGFNTYKPRPARQTCGQLEELRETIFHHVPNDQLLIPRSSLDREGILRLCAELSPGSRLALRSEIQVSGAPKFIPMIDFICEKSEANLRLLSSQLGHLHRIDGFNTGGGVLLETDNSYHYQARRLLPLDKWTSFIGHVLLLHPPAEHRELAHRTGALSVIDVRWAGHVLIGGGGALRISQNFDGKFPRVVKQVAA